MARFLITNFFYAPDISDPNVWKFVQTEIERDFPWLIPEGHEIWFSGIGRGWRGWRRREQIISHAAFKSLVSNALNGALAWLTHSMDILRTSHNGPIIVLAPTPESGLGAALIKSIACDRVHLVTRVQGHTASKALYVKQSRLRWVALSCIERFVLRKSDLVVPMGQFTLNLALAYGVKPDKVVVLPFPVRWADEAEVTEPPDRPTVLFVGRLEKEKGVHILLKAMALVREKLPNVHLLIAGDGSYRSHLEHIAHSLGLQGIVSFLGWLKSKDLKEVYKETTVLCLPSIWEEGLGMVLVEAGLMARLVIASDIGGIRDVVRHGENGFLVPPGDPTALADAIITVLRDRDMACRMGLAGTKIAREYLEGREEAVERIRCAILKLLE